MKSKSYAIYLCTVFLVLYGMVVTSVAMGASAQAMVSVKIVRPLNIKTVSDMSFGNVSTSDTSGTVEVQQDGQRIATGGVLLEIGGPSTPAAFTVNGQPNGRFVVELPKTVNMTDDQGDTMTVDNLTSSTGTSIMFDKNGKQELKIGAKLHVNSYQKVGYYTGSLNVTINYD